MLQPRSRRSKYPNPVFAPHTLVEPGGDGDEVVLPAHAGMVPLASMGWGRRRCAPRVRGDGPFRPGDLQCLPKKVVLARFVHNDRLIDALGSQAFAALNASPGARAYYDQIRVRDVGHRAALRQVANRLVGILHGCLKTGTLYDETTAWSHRIDRAEKPAA
jgi:hypothetical protein